MERGDFDCFLLAGRYTLLEQGALARFLPLCTERDISVIVGGPFNSGLLVSDLEPGAPYNYSAADRQILERARSIREICRSHAVALPVAALQFPLFHPAVASVIPGARSAAEVLANAAALETPVPAALWSDLVSEGLLAADAPTLPFPPQDAVEGVGVRTVE